MTSSRGEPSQFTALRGASASASATSQQPLTKRRQTLPAYSDNSCERVQKYKDHFSFLRNSKFLQDLENDSVDSDIIEEELSALQEVPISTREKVAKFLQSNPVQILLCVIVLLDAGIVIAQILLDLNSVKDKLHRRDLQLSSLLRYIRETQSSKLHGYTGEDVDLILRMLRDEPSRDGLNRTTSNLTTVQDRSRHNRTTQATGSGIVAESVAKRDSHTAVMADYHHVEQGEHDLLHEVAHGLHFASIALLGFLVIEDLIKIIAMGRTFFKHKIEIFDAVIIASSFTIDIVFLGGVSGEEGQKAAAVLVILLLWRIARVVDGIVVTVKQRQEFRIRLQKRARRIAEKKLESFEEERHSKTRQIEALKDLCTKAGITDADIAACAPVDPKRVNTTLCALSSVARLSVSMTMLMSSGVYRPRILDERLVLPKMFNPRTKEPSTATATTTQQQRRGVLPRIESLPIMKNSYMGSAGASKKQQRRHRKSASGKIYRKNDEEGGGRAGGGGSGSKRMTSTTTIETTEECSHVTIESTTSSGASGPEMDHRGQLTEESPVNSSGVHIVIDRGSDAELDVLPVTEVAETDRSSPPNIVGPRPNSTDTGPDHNAGYSHSTGPDNGTGPASGATPGFNRGCSEPGPGIESEVGSGNDTIASLHPITSPESEATHGSTLGSDPSCKSAPNHFEAPESCKSFSPGQGSSSNSNSTPRPSPGTSNGPTPGPNNSIIAGLINDPIPGPSKGPTSGPSNALTQGPSHSCITAGSSIGPTLGSSPGSVIDPGLLQSSDPADLCLSSDHHAHMELVRSDDSPSNSQSILLSDI